VDGKIRKNRGAEREMDNQFQWVDFYKKFAGKLLAYQNNRTELVEKVKAIYETTGINMPTLELNNQLVDIDPFTVFGLFNKSRMREENRIKIITAVKDIFDVEEEVPTSFESVPVLNQQNATFYYFIDSRGADDIDDLWNLFASALTYADVPNKVNRDTLAKYFDLVINKKGNGNAKVTMGLYWISPESFLNLDSRNEWYIYESGRLPEAVVSELPEIDTKISAEKYFVIVERLRDYLNSEESKVKNYKELSLEAWKYSSHVDEQKKTSKATFLRWFAPLIQALKDLGGSATPSEARGKIAENENLTAEEISETRGKTNVNKFANDVAFARSYLVVAGYIDKSVHGIWTLTEAGEKVEMTDDLASDICKKVVSDNQSKRELKGSGLADDDVETIHVWLYSVFDDKSWEECKEKGQIFIGVDKIGDLRDYSSKEEIRKALIKNYEGSSSRKNQALMAWNFANTIKVDDVIFAKKGQVLLGKGIVSDGYFYDEERSENKNVLYVNWVKIQDQEHPGKAVAKRLTDITAYTDYVEKLNALYEAADDEDDVDEEKEFPVYSEENFMNDVYMDGESYDTLVELIHAKKNVILQGAPGVGKTYAAKRLAYSMMGVKDQDRVMMVQFHQSYSYEDFIEGFRPSSTGDGFEIKKGSFYNFCKKAADDIENEYFFIIDEINRGNLSKIFGELFMLIENDKRGNALQLLYSDEKFYVPANVYIIGMMNTADRSLAMLDYALRRRFAFFDMKPGFSSDGFRGYRMNFNNRKFDSLIDCVEKMNAVIADDDALGEGFCIGHSYFCNLTAITDKALSNIVEYEIVPLLKEYWYDEPIKVKDWTDKLRSSIK
jgi:5-methylcytosine-specific restriction protein B